MGEILISKTFSLFLLYLVPFEIKDSANDKIIKNVSKIEHDG